MSQRTLQLRFLLSFCSLIGLLPTVPALASAAEGESRGSSTGYRQYALTGGELAWFVDEAGESNDFAMVLFSDEVALTDPLPDPREVTTTVRFFSDTADTLDTGFVVLDRSRWQRSRNGFEYKAWPVKGRAPGGIVKIVFMPGRHGGKLLIVAKAGDYGANPIRGPVEYVQVTFGVGSSVYSGRFVSPPAEVVANTPGQVIFAGDGASIAPPPGHEILDVRGFPNLVVWITSGLSQEEFAAIDLPPGMFKNQPREGVGAMGRFLRTPGQADDGQFIYREMYGARWLHNATVVDFGEPPGTRGFFTGSYVAKRHELFWRAGSRIWVLESPGGEQYIMIGRDRNRTTDDSPIPPGWSVSEHDLEEDLQILLPDPTLNLRTNNQDSFQGPVSLELSR